VENLRSKRASYPSPVDCGGQRTPKFTESDFDTRVVHCYPQDGISIVGLSVKFNNALLNEREHIRMHVLRTR
jgi:hypothetical protein